MSNTKTVMSQAANTLVTPPVNVEDVFSTYLYEGTGAAQTITNSIDLDGKGGLVWIKHRAVAFDHILADTERGTSKYSKLTTQGQNTGATQTITSFNSDGFSIGNLNDVNYGPDPDELVSWTFRKAPKFFDVVTYTGDGTQGREIGHDLNSEVGMVIVKQTNTTRDWFVWHKGIGNGWAKLNTTDAASPNGYQIWGLDDGTNTYVAPTSSVVTISGDTACNESGGSYVMYLFAHNDGDGEFGPDGDADIIKCGSYTGNGSTDGNFIDLGWEPQWVMVKNTNLSAEPWVMLDNMRGVTGGNDPRLTANSSAAEAFGQIMEFNSTGFTSLTADDKINGSGHPYIYIAIRRGTKVPESGTEVFAPTYPYSVNGNITAYLGSPTDAVFQGLTGGGNSAFPVARSRLTGGNRLTTSSTAAEVSDATSFWDNMFGFHPAGETGSTNTNTIYWNFKRAPNFFDVVAYTGNGTAGHTVSHNLGVTPEMIWVKNRSSAITWVIQTKIGATESYGFFDTGAFFSGSNYSDINASNIQLLSNTSSNGSGSDYIMYLFASLDGVSKVGSYTGSSSAQTIDCGFTTGARFVMIKNVTDSGTNWVIFDTERGIVSGNDPYLWLNSTAAEDSVGAYDYLDPHPSGFTLEATNFFDTNDDGKSYIFYAIA